MKQAILGIGGLFGVTLLITLVCVWWGGPSSKPVYIHGMLINSHKVMIEQTWHHPDSTMSVWFTQDGKKYGMEDITRRQYDSLLAIE